MLSGNKGRHSYDSELLSPVNGKPTLVTEGSVGGLKVGSYDSTGGYFSFSKSKFVPVKVDGCLKYSCVFLHRNPSKLIPNKIKYAIQIQDRQASLRKDLKNMFPTTK